MSPRGGPWVLTATRLPADLLARVDALAQAEDVSRSEMIRRLLDEALRRRKK